MNISSWNVNYFYITLVTLNCKWLRVCFHVFSPPNIHLQLIPSNLGDCVSPFSSHTQTCSFSWREVMWIGTGQNIFALVQPAFEIGICESGCVQILWKKSRHRPHYSCGVPTILLHPNPKNKGLSRDSTKNGEWEIMERHPNGEWKGRQTVGYGEGIEKKSRPLCLEFTLWKANRFTLAL
jgi:hypothetical protein